MRIHVADHPLVAHKLTALRDERTDSLTFRRLADELVTLLAYEATRDVRTESVEVTTPVATTTGVRLAAPKPLVVPILRAGLGMLDGMMRLLPTAEVGFLGMIRDESTLQASTYATRLPDDLSGRQCYVLDPMLATGGTLVAAINFLRDRGADDITAICLLAAPEGLAAMEAAFEQAAVRSPSWSPGWTRSSTTSATSSPASATPATASTASSDPPSGRRQLTTFGTLGVASAGMHACCRDASPTKRGQPRAWRGGLRRRRSHATACASVTPRANPQSADPAADRMSRFFC